MQLRAQGVKARLYLLWDCILSRGSVVALLSDGSAHHLRKVNTCSAAGVSDDERSVLEFDAWSRSSLTCSFHGHSHEKARSVITLPSCSRNTSPTSIGLRLTNFPCITTAHRPLSLFRSGIAVHSYCSRCLPSQIPVVWRTLDPRPTCMLCQRNRFTSDSVPSTTCSSLVCLGSSGHSVAPDEYLLPSSFSTSLC